MDTDDSMRQYRQYFHEHQGTALHGYWRQHETVSSGPAVHGYCRQHETISSVLSRTRGTNITRILTTAWDSIVGTFTNMREQHYMDTADNMWQYRREGVITSYMKYVKKSHRNVTPFVLHITITFHATTPQAYIYNTSWFRLKADISSQYCLGTSSILFTRTPGVKGHDQVRGEHAFQQIRPDTRHNTISLSYLSVETNNNLWHSRK
jgi:hypothetical protein